MSAAPTLTLLAARVRMLGHVIVGLRRGGAFKVAVIAAMGAAMVAALFSAISFAFRFMQLNADYHAILVGYLLSMYFLAMLLMLIFSNAVISFGGLFRSPETAMLMAMPLPANALYGYKVGEALLFSSWAFLVTGGPLLAAFGRWGSAAPLGWGFYPVAGAMMVPFVFIPASLGAALGMVLTLYFPRNRGKVLGLGFAALAAAATVLSMRAGLFEADAAVDERFVARVFAGFSFSQSPWMPSSWISEGIQAAARGAWPAAGFAFALLAATAFFLWMLGDLLAEKLYARSYSRALGSPARRFYRSGGALDWLAERAARTAPFTARLVAKDLRTFLRDPAQWSQVIIFFGLLFFYVANLRNLGYQKVVENFSSLRWTNFVSFANLAAAGFTLATLTTRFVFPMVSLEGKRLWVLGLLPIRRSRLLLGKYLFALGGALLLMVPLMLLSGYMLGTAGRLAWMHAATALTLCAGLPGIAVGMGAVFPNFREDSPAKVVSGFGGTLCLVLSLAFVGLAVIAVGSLCYQYTLAQEGFARLKHPLLWAGAVLGAASAAAVALPLAAGCRAINRMEV